MINKLWHSSHLQKIQKGISSARSDDTKSLKGVVVDWITPQDSPLVPPLSRNVKTTRGFHHPVTGSLLCPASLDWNDAEFAIIMITEFSTCLHRLQYARSF